MTTEPFPKVALEANRSGRLTPEQVVAFKAEAATDRSNLLFAGVAIAGLGIALLFGALTGKIAGSGVGPLLLGSAFVVVGVVVGFSGGIGGSRAKIARADAGRVTSLEGPIKRERVDRRSSLDGGSAHYSPGNEYAYYLVVGDRRFDVGEPQWDAAPEDGIVRVYLLGDSSRIVNLERIADAPPPEVPAVVRFALERAAASSDPAHAAQARAMLAQAGVMSSVVDAPAAGAPAAPGAPVVAAAPTADAAPSAAAIPLEQAIVGTWKSDLAGITYEFRADGSVVAASERHGSGDQRWAMAGPAALRLGDDDVPARVDGDTLWLGEPPRGLSFRRVG